MHSLSLLATCRPLLSSCMGLLVLVVVACCFPLGEVCLDSTVVECLLELLLPALICFVQGLQVFSVLHFEGLELLLDLLSRRRFLFGQ